MKSGRLLAGVVTAAVALGGITACSSDDSGERKTNDTKDISIEGSAQGEGGDSSNGDDKPNQASDGSEGSSGNSSGSSASSNRSSSKDSITKADAVSSAKNVLEILDKLKYTEDFNAQVLDDKIGSPVFMSDNPASAIDGLSPEKRAELLALTERQSGVLRGVSNYDNLSDTEKILFNAAAGFFVYSNYASPTSGHNIDEKKVKKQENGDFYVPREAMVYTRDNGDFPATSSDGLLFYLDESGEVKLDAIAFMSAYYMNESGATIGGVEETPPEEMNAGEVPEE